MTDTATIGHNSAAIGEMIEADPGIVYRETGMAEQLLASIEEEIRLADRDTSTASGRKAIASLAHSVSTRKAPIEKAGLSLTEDHRKAVTAINTIKKQIVDGMDALRIKAREPLTKWEDEQKARDAKIAQARTLFADAVNMRGDKEDALRYIKQIEAVEVSPDVFGDLADVARGEQATAVAALHSIIERLDKEAADRAELERLRAEKAESERAAIEAEKQRQAEAAEKARIEAAEKAAADRAANEARLKAQAEIDAANKAAAAAQAELDRQAREKAEADRQEAAREADKKHRSAVMKSAKDAIMEHSKITEDAAKAIVLAIVAGSVPNVTLRF